MIYSDSCEAFVEEGGNNILRKSVTEKTGRNYELAMKVKQNIIEWSQRNTNTEGKYTTALVFPPNILINIGVGKTVNELKSIRF